MNRAREALLPRLQHEFLGPWAGAADMAPAPHPGPSPHRAAGDDSPLFTVVLRMRSEPRPWQHADSTSARGVLGGLHQRATGRSRAAQSSGHMRASAAPFPPQERL